MHDGCSGSFTDGIPVIHKLRSMGFSSQPMPMPMQIQCECKNEFEMETFEDRCPHCGMIYGVTPCHAFDPANVMAAGRAQQE